MGIAHENVISRVEKGVGGGGGMDTRSLQLEKFIAFISKTLLLTFFLFFILNL